MGLLEKADAKNASGGSVGPLDLAGVKTLVADFSLMHRSFHCLILRRGGDGNGLSRELAEMTSCHGAVCGDMAGGKCILLLPGTLDMELFSHRISKSSGAIVVFQSSYDSPSTALDSLKFHLT